jgi:hypothetical protein
MIGAQAGIAACARAIRATTHIRVDHRRGSLQNVASRVKNTCRGAPVSRV